MTKPLTAADLLPVVFRVGDQTVSAIDAQFDAWATGPLHTASMRFPGAPAPYHAPGYHTIIR